MGVRVEQAGHDGGAGEVDDRRAPRDREPSLPTAFTVLPSTRMTWSFAAVPASGIDQPARADRGDLGLEGGSQQEQQRDDLKGAHAGDSDG